MSDKGLRHKWQTEWDDKELLDIQTCVTCGLKSRKAKVITAGGGILSGRQQQYLINGKWVQAISTDHPCVAKQKLKT
jgi:hypothetical protein